MPRGVTFSRICTHILAFALAIGPAVAHEGHVHEDCGPDEICGPAATTGSWGLIALGILFWLVALIPSNKGEGDDTAPKTKIPFLSMLQTRMDKETKGWRRLQWPVLGFAFIALGVATLLDWR